MIYIYDSPEILYPKEVSINFKKHEHLEIYVNKTRVQLPEFLTPQV